MFEIICVLILVVVVLSAKYIVTRIVLTRKEDDAEIERAKLAAAERIARLNRLAKLEARAKRRK